MEIVTFENAPLYTAPNHEEVVARRLQGGEATSVEFALVGHSTFAAGCGVPMDAAPIGKVYIVTEGTLAFIEESGTKHHLGAGDSIHILPNEARAVLNETDSPAAMIVITPPTA